VIPSHQIRKFLQLQFQAHPWHGIAPHPHGPHRRIAPPEPHIGGAEHVVSELYNAFIELTPFDGVKYEVDKETGHIKVDRPQKFSNLCPTLYGFIPRTYCGDMRRQGIAGDGDPLDICVLTEKPISHTGIVVTARPIGGLRMIDADQADDKIIAVLDQDVTYGHLNSILDLPPGLLDRLRQYFLTYKLPPPKVRPDGSVMSAPPTSTVEIPQVYDRDEAIEVINHSMDDYRDKFGAVHEDLAHFLFELARTVGSHPTDSTP
jgi:inorganic pyrophosphatase